MADMHWVVVSGIALSWLCFAVYAAQTLAAIARKPLREARAIVERARAAAVRDDRSGLALPSLPELTALMDAMARLIDSFAKAGPGLAAIAASVLFLLIAAIGAGALRP